MYVGIWGCCNMYFLLWTVVKKSFKVTHLTKPSSYPITRLHTQVFFFPPNKGILFGIGCFLTETQREWKPELLMVQDGLNYTTDCSILAQPSHRPPERKPEAHFKQGTRQKLVQQEVGNWKVVIPA